LESLFSHGPGTDKLFQQFSLNEPWNSEYNLPLVKKMGMDRYFYCPADCPSDNPDVSQCPYVAITGQGTVWTALREGIITRDTFREEFRDMILFILPPE
jgi:hypothetical protein